MRKADGSLIYIVGIIVVFVVAAAIAVALSFQPNANGTIVTVLGFAATIAAQFFNAAKNAETKQAVAETNQVVVETRAKVEETRASVGEAKDVIAATHTNLEVVRQDVNDKMQKMQEEIRRSSYAQGVKDEQEKSARRAATAQAVTDAAKVQVYEGQAVAGALPAAVLAHHELTASELAAQVTLNTARLDEILAALTRMGVQALMTPAGPTAPLGTADDPILTQEVMPEDPRYRKPKDKETKV